MADVTALAGALESATPEMLRGWAAIAVARDVNDREDLARMGASPSTNPANNAFLGLAALALAVSQAAHTSDARIEQAGRADYLILDIPMPETHTMGYGACELIPALAATLRGAP